MRIGSKIFLSYLILIGIGFFYLTDTVLKNIAKRYLEGVEESLVDEARILSAVISFDISEKGFPEEKLKKVFNKIYSEKFRAKIYKLTKKNVDLRVYITDNKGIVVFDSMNLIKKGTDYSRWRDVNRTLKGVYGARSTDSVPGKSESRVLYVAAPITVKSKLKGVLTVAKPSTNINIFIHDTARKVIKFSYIASLAFVILSFAIAFVITRPIKKLTNFANDIRAGKRVNLPDLPGDEIGQMGKAFEAMLNEIEGKKYVEKYVHTLTHEIKSPVSAIRGASELLMEDMPKEQMQRFIKNIDVESRRIEDLVNRMLELSSLENRKEINVSKGLELSELVSEVISSFNPVIEKTGIKVDLNMEKNVKTDGDPFILRQAMANLLSNAIEFSKVKGRIEINLIERDGKSVFEVIDEGPGIPDFALDKLFDKFYSLPRPENGKKSTGLGLSFVKEAVILHGGDVEVVNMDKGVKASITLKSS